MHFFHSPECSNIALFNITLHYITIIYSILQQLLAVYICLICILATCAWLGEGRSSQPSCLPLMITLDAAGGWPSYVVGEYSRAVKWSMMTIHNFIDQQLSQNPPPPFSSKKKWIGALWIVTHLHVCSAPIARISVRLLPNLLLCMSMWLHAETLWQ